MTGSKSETVEINRLQKRTLVFKSYRDMCDMTNLNEAELTRNLEERFKGPGFDYMTYVGSTLLVVNPFSY
jgi:myosin heavy subunit